MYITDLSKQPLPERLPLNDIHIYHDINTYEHPSQLSDAPFDRALEYAETEERIMEYLDTDNLTIVPTERSGLHMLMELVGIKEGTRVFCSDLCYSRSYCPVCLTGGLPIFIDSAENQTGMDPEALEKAFESEPDVKFVLISHTLGIPCAMKQLTEIAHRHHALVIEDAGDAFGAVSEGLRVGAMGDFSFISFEGPKITTGYRGAAIVCDNNRSYDRLQLLMTNLDGIRPWFQQEDVARSYMFNRSTAAVFKSQFQRMEQHLRKKADIFERYRKAFADLPATVCPAGNEYGSPNYWLSFLLLDQEILCEKQDGGLYLSEHGKTSPHEIIDALFASNIECSAMEVPLHCRSEYRNCRLISSKEQRSCSEDFAGRCVILPSDIGMTDEQQDRVIEVVRRCFL